jgi:hypothetical protein
MQRLLSGARRGANLAFPDNDVSLRNEFQDGIHQPADFASEIERAGKVHATRLAHPLRRGDIPVALFHSPTDQILEMISAKKLEMKSH